MSNREHAKDLQIPIKAMAALFAVAASILVLSAAAKADDLATLPDWNDEQAAYARYNINTNGAQIHISDGQYSRDRIDKFASLSNLGDTHGNTEGDDLWTAYMMYKRLDGIHQTAANDWYSRAQSLAGFFTNNFIGGEAWQGDLRYNFDHMYGWGLCEWAKGEGDAAAAATVDRIVNEMVQWNANTHVRNVGTRLLDSSAGGRRWSRQLRLAVCAAELNGSPVNRGWRDKIIDMMLASPDWDSQYNMYWLGTHSTDGRLGSGAYANGDRVANTFHMGIWMDSLWKAYWALAREQDSRAPAVRQRLIDMATFYRDIGTGPNGELNLIMGRNINTGAPIRASGTGSPSQVYNLPPVNGLVFAYKFTGDQSYLDAAWTVFRNFQFLTSGSAGTLDHYTDSQLSSATGFNFLANNKGELQYTYALFDNGGNPTLVDGTVADLPPPKKPNPPVLEGDVADPEVVSVSLQAASDTIQAGQTASLSWTSSGADSCTASLGWSGPRGTSGSEQTAALNTSTQYRLTCINGSGGGATDSVTVFVNSPDGTSQGGVPSWYANAADRTWINLGSAVGASTFDQNDPVRTFADWDFGTQQSGFDYHTAVIDAWNGGAAREDYYIIGLSGGHRGSAQNTIYEFGPFTSETPDWHWYGTDPTKYDAPSHSGTPGGTITNWSGEENVPYYSDGKPSAAHTYDHLAFIPDLGGGVGNMLFRPIASFVWSGSNSVSGSFAETASFKFTSTNDVGGVYEPRNTYPDFEGRRGPGGLVEWDPNTEKVWIMASGGKGGGTRPVYSFDPRTGQYTFHADSVAGSFSSDTDGGSLDPERQIMVINTDSGLVVIDLSAGREGDSVFVNNYSGGIARNGNIGMEYEPVGKKFVGYNGGAAIYTMQPPSNYRNSDGSLNGSAVWTWQQVSNGSGGISPSGRNSTGTYGRFRYISSIKAFAVINDANDAMYVYKVPSGGL